MSPRKCIYGYIQCKFISLPIRCFGLMISFFTLNPKYLWILCLAYLFLQICLLFYCSSYIYVHVCVCERHMCSQSYGDNVAYKWTSLMIQLLTKGPKVSLDVGMCRRWHFLSASILSLGEIGGGGGQRRGGGVYIVHPAASPPRCVFCRSSTMALESLRMPPDWHLVFQASPWPHFRQISNAALDFCKGIIYFRQYILYGLV